MPFIAIRQIRENLRRGQHLEASAEDGRGSGVIAGEVDNIIAVRGVPPAQRRAGEVRLIVENPASRVGAEFEKKVTEALAALRRVLQRFSRSCAT